MERVLWVVDFDNTISHRTQYEGDIELETYQDGIITVKTKYYKYTQN